MNEVAIVGCPSANAHRCALTLRYRIRHDTLSRHFVSCSVLESQLFGASDAASTKLEQFECDSCRIGYCERSTPTKCRTTSPRLIQSRASQALTRRSIPSAEQPSSSSLCWLRVSHIEALELSHIGTPDVFLRRCETEGSSLENSQSSFRGRCRAA